MSKIILCLCFTLLSVSIVSGTRDLLERIIMREINATVDEYNVMKKTYIEIIRDMRNTSDTYHKEKEEQVSSDISTKAEQMKELSEGIAPEKIKYCEALDKDFLRVSENMIKTLNECGVNITHQIDSLVINFAKDIDVELSKLRGTAAIVQSCRKNETSVHKTLTCLKSTREDTQVKKDIKRTYELMKIWLTKITEDFETCLGRDYSIFDFKSKDFYESYRACLSL